MNTGKVFVGILAGVAVGALLGVLFAPDKGSETRRKISRKSKDFVDDVKHKYDDFVRGVNEKMDEVKQETENLKSRATRASSEI
jgi:gas vesicle protein